MSAAGGVWIMKPDKDNVLFQWEGVPPVAGGHRYDHGCDPDHHPAEGGKLTGTRSR